MDHIGLSRHSGRRKPSPDPCSRATNGEQAGREKIERLCIHSITTKPWSLETAIEHYQDKEVRGITIWRNALENKNPAKVRKCIKEAGMTVVSLCRGGFFAAPDARSRQRALDENRKALDEAAELDTKLLVLVCGAVPGQLLEISRQQIRDGIERLLPHAEACGVRLGIEPLHPMYADCRSAVNTLRQANEMCEAIDNPSLGVVVDIYHLWWDPDLEVEIRRCGRAGRIFSFHVADWLSPTDDLLYDRGLMGEGCIPIPQIREWVESVGFDGFIEVEIFSERYWAMDQRQFLDRIVESYRNYV